MQEPAFLHAGPETIDLKWNRHRRIVEESSINRTGTIIKFVIWSKWFLKIN